MQLYSSNDSKQKIKRNNHRHTKKTNKQTNSSKTGCIHDNQQFTVQMLSPKNEVYIASRNNHHDDSSGTPNLLENSFIIMLTRLLSKDIYINYFQKLWSGQENEQYGCQYEGSRAKKTKYFWHSSTVCLEPVCKIFIKTRFTAKSSECLCRDILRGTPPYSIP